MAVERALELTLTRRSFGRGALVVVLAPSACARWEPAAPPAPVLLHGWTIPPGTHLSPERYATLSAVMDALLPGEVGFAGAVEVGAPRYLDGLLGAFESDPPRIYAGGPYSGRHGGLDGFSRFQPLSRVESIRWRTYVEGSRGIPEREFNGPVEGIQDRYERLLTALDAAARAEGHPSYAALGRDLRRSLLLGVDAEQVEMVYAHAVEGTYGDPVYGGNAGGLGWAAIGYEGDRQPLGYTDQQLAHPEEA